MHIHSFSINTSDQSDTDLDRCYTKECFMRPAQGCDFKRCDIGAGAKTSVIVNNKQFETISHFWNLRERPGVSISRQEVT